MVTLSRRFSAAFILIVALPSLLVSVILARLYLSALYQTVAQQTEVTAEQVAQNIRTETDNVAILAAALIHDSRLRELTEAYSVAPDRKEQYLATRRLDEKLVSFFNYTKQVGAVVLYLRGGATYAYSNYPNIRGIASIDRSVLAGAAADPGKVYLLDTFEAVTRNIGEKNMISLAVCPAPNDQSSIEAILVMFRVPYFDGLMARWGDDAGSAVVIFGRSGKPILSSLPAEAIGDELGTLAHSAAPAAVRDSGLSVREVRAAGRSWLATLYPMSSTGWTVVLLADHAGLSGRVTKYQWYLYPALALRSFCTDAAEYVGRYLSVKVTFAVGPVCPGVPDAAESYRAARAARTIESRIVVLAKRAIRKRFSDPAFSLEEASVRAGVSKNHLSFEFSRESGETFTEYLSRTRVEEAKRLLATTDQLAWRISGDSTLPQQALDRKIKFTDPVFVKAATELQNLVKAGLFQ